MPKKAKPTKKKADVPKVFDVMRPGKVAANSTSRPVIVGHKPQVRDPMMSERDDARSLMDSKQKVTVASTNTAGAMTGPEKTVQNQNAAPTEVSQATAGIAPEVPLQQKTTAPTMQPAADVTAPQDELATVALSDIVQQPNVTAEPSVPATAVEPAAEIAQQSNETPPQTRPVEQIQPEPEVPQPSPASAEPLPGTTGAIYDEVPNAPLESPAQFKNAAPLPELPPEDVPPPKVHVVVSTHKPRKSMAARLGWAVFALFLVVIALDILLDAGIFTLSSVPHTSFF